MKILTADIGGTSSRFAFADLHGPERVKLGAGVVFETAEASIRSFDGLIRHYQHLAGVTAARMEACEAVVVAVAGAVEGRAAVLPNIPWDIDLRGRPGYGNMMLVNDFEAQAYACTVRASRDRFVEIHGGAGRTDRSVAIVGAGTGLGHCLLLPDRGAAQAHRALRVVASEHGHAGFPFLGPEERRLEEFMLARTGQPYVSYDAVVSGGGIRMVHEFLTGASVHPSQALAPGGDNGRTIEWFTRFFARACRNYCLATRAFDALVLSGGIAAGNPHLFECGAFVREFCAVPDYGRFLRRVAIFLNTDPLIGLRGAAVYGHARLARRGPAG